MKTKITKLDNQIRIVTDEMKDVESVSLGMWVGAGSRNETKEINGISHVLEHMAFKGTLTRSAKDIAEEIESAGGIMNAYTSNEMTAFYVKVLKEDVALAVDIISDILRHSTFDETELKKEKSVICQEISKTFDDPEDYIFDMYFSAAFPDQPLGRTILGPAENVNRFTPTNLNDYIRNQYLSSRMVFSAAGNVSHETMVKLVQDKFGDIPSQNNIKLAAPVYKGGEIRLPRDIEQALIVMGFKGIGYNGNDACYALNLMSIILGGGMSSRLFQEVREKRGLVYHTSSFPSFYTDTGLFNIYAGTSNDKSVELIPVVCNEIAKMTETVSEKELEKAKTQLKAGILMSRESTSNRSDRNASKVLVYNEVLSPDEVIKKIENVSTKDITAMAKQVFTSDLSLAVLGDISKVESADKIQERLSRALGR